MHGFLANYNEAKTMRVSRVYPNAWKKHMAQLAMYHGEVLAYNIGNYL